MTDSGAANSRYRILLIEDTPEILELMSLLLSSAGYEVLEAGTGEEGLELASREHPHLTLLDLELPGMDGLEVLRRLRAEPNLAGHPILALTAANTQGERERLLAAGFTGYLAKPVRPRHLLQQIAAFLSNRSP